jgi:hypothetical protein
MELNFVEGDFRPDCPLQGRRVLIVLEAVALFGQLIGKQELRLRPLNQELERQYVDVYGFEAGPEGESYFRRPI